MADVPTEKPTLRGRIVGVTPIILTVLATALAGLSSSEMTQSMYHRSLAGQQQSKAGDQWSFFQAKRIRGTNMDMTGEMLQSFTTPPAFDLDRLVAQCRALSAALEKSGGDAAGAREKAAALAKMLTDPATREALAFVSKSNLPVVETLPIEDAEAAKHLRAVLDDIAQRKPEPDTVTETKFLSAGHINEAIRNAEASADAFDKACTPTVEMLGGLRAAASELASAVASLPASGAVTEAKSQANAIQAAIQIAAIRFDARRYSQEAKYNRQAAEVYEVRVRRSGVESDRRRDRSKLFFYCMLVAQAGVTIATLALGRKSRGTLWMLATVAGLAAVTGTGYIYVAF